jgi:HD-GYP domain-containing protein (c-di-GMP phosphodiesterase class II)
MVQSDKNILFFLQRLKLHGSYLWQHSLNTTIMTLYLYSTLKVDEQQLFFVALNALLHDIGMLYIDETIWNNSRSLNEVEKELIEEHPGYGAWIISKQDSLKGYALFAREHHERVNSKNGYPAQKKLKNISLHTRRFSIIDSYEAMVFPRKYKKTLSPYYAVKELISLSGTEYDAKAVSSFVKAFSLYPPGTYLNLSNGNKGRVLRSNIRSMVRPIILSQDEVSKEVTEIDLLEHFDLFIKGVIQEELA